MSIPKKAARNTARAGMAASNKNAASVSLPVDRDGVVREQFKLITFKIVDFILYHFQKYIS